jgi:Tetratricopeptide repeat
MAGDDSRAQVQLDQDTLARRRRVLGEDHPDTLTAASNLAMLLGRLGEPQAARELAEDTLARRRRVLGEDHPDTLTSAFILAAQLAELGEYQAAKELGEDTLARRRRVLGRGPPRHHGLGRLRSHPERARGGPESTGAHGNMKAAWSQPGEGREPDS